MTVNPYDKTPLMNIGRSFLALPTTLSTITLGTTTSQQAMLNANNENSNDAKIKSFFETGSSESCNSLSWNPHSSFELLAGVNGKALKIYDIRGKTFLFFPFKNLFL
jgi:hypothetical protein